MFLLSQDELWLRLKRSRLRVSDEFLESKYNIRKQDKAQGLEDRCKGVIIDVPWNLEQVRVEINM